MLRKKYKLPIQSFVGKRGEISKTPYFLLRKFASGSEYSRFGVTISVKAAPKATDRNRMKRLIYDFAAKTGKKLPTADYWVSVLPDAMNLPKKQFMRELEKILR